MLVILFCLVIIVPIYRTANRKGYPHRPLVIATIAYTVGVWLIVFVVSSAGVDHWALEFAWLPVSLLLIVLQVLPSRRDEAGRDWFTLETSCPACGSKIEFDRDRIGLVDDCPRCGEILTLPTGASPESEGTYRAVGTGEGAMNDRDATDDREAEGSRAAAASGEIPAGDGWVLLRSHDSTHLAELDKARLEEAGLPVLVQPIGAGAIFGATTLGCQLLVPATELERAREVLSAPDAEMDSGGAVPG